MRITRVFTIICIISTLLFLTNLIYEISDLNIETLYSTSTIVNRERPINPHVKQFASETAFCNLTSPFATDQENNMKERIYHTILSNQFHANPSTECSQKEYWITTMHWKSGLGWQLHKLALELLTAISQNKIFIWGNNYDHWPFMQSPFCSTMECYFEPITNCSLPKEKEMKFTKLPTLKITLELQAFWNPILEITKEAKGEFLSRSSHEYTLLVTIAQWYLLRYNKRTHRIIANNIESTLNLMHLGADEMPNPNEMISIPIRHSDKCYDTSYNNYGAEMLCFEAKHIVKIAQQIQFLYEYNGDIKYGIVNSEDSIIIQQIINASDRSFHVLTNVNDIRPETGDPRVWTKNRPKNRPDKLENKLENDFMTSMLTVAQLSSIPRYWLYIFSSNWFFYLSHFRTILKCWPHNMDKAGDIRIELKSFCKLCPARLQPGHRVAIYRGLTYDVYENEFIWKLLDVQCVNWIQRYFENINRYEVHCQLTDRFDD